MPSVITEAEPQKKIALDTQQDSTPHPSVSYGGSSASGARPSATASTDQNTSTSDVTRASSKDHIGGDVAMEGERADEISAGRPNPSGSDSRRRITTKREPREVRDEQSSTTEQHVPRRILGEDDASRTRSCCHHARGNGRIPRETMRIANVENNTLNWVSTSSAGALDMTHCDFSARAARDEMRHTTGSSEPDVIIGSDKDRNWGCRKKGKDHI